MHKKTLWTMAKCVLAAWIFWLLWHSELLAPALLQRLFVLDVALLRAVLALVLVVAIAGVRWWVLMRIVKLRVPLVEALKINYIAYGLSQFLPGGVGGDVAKIAFIVKHAPQEKTAGVTSILVDRAIGLASIMLLVVVACAVFRSALPPHPALQMMVDASLIGVGLVFAVGAIAVLLPDDIGLQALIKRLLGAGKFTHVLQRLLHALHAYRRAPLGLIGALGLSVASQCTCAYALWSLAVHMDMALPLWQVLLASSIAQVASLLPVTPGGIGVGEAAFSATITVLGNPTSLGAASIMLAMRCLSVMLSVPAYAGYLKRATPR